MLAQNLEAYARAHVSSLYEDLSCRRVQPLRQGWRFHFGEALGAQDPAYDDRAWSSVQVPHDYAITQGFEEGRPTTGSGGYVQSGVAWYRLHLDIPDGSRRYILHFDGVQQNAQVYLNGVFLGQHPNGATPFWYDVTPFANFGGDNVLCVRADSSLQPFSRFYGGLGICRDVALVETGPVYLRPFGLYAAVQTLSDTSVTIRVTADLGLGRNEALCRAVDGEGERNLSAPCQIRTRVYGPDGQCVSEGESRPATLTTTNRVTLQQELSWEQPQPWLPESPALYTVHTEVLSEGVVTDDSRIPLGLRVISYDAQGFYVNGKAYKFKGACIHQDLGFYGAATPLKAWLRALTDLKDMGCNAVRTAHHPFPAVFYHACDVMGLMVMDEAFDEWHRTWRRSYSETPSGKNTYGYYLYFDQWAETDVAAMVLRDRNHPSVVLWSLGNEVPDFYFDDGVDVMRRLHDTVRRYDITRPTTEGAEGQCNLPLNEELLDVTDIQGLNYTDLRYREKFYDPMHDKHPDWLMVGSETTHQPYHWQAVARSPYACGQFIWTGIDYLGEAHGRKLPEAVAAPDFTGKRLIFGSMNAPIDNIGQPRSAFYYRRSLWDETPMVHLSVNVGPFDPWQLFGLLPAVDAWNWRLGSLIHVYCFTTCEEVDVTLNGRPVAHLIRDPQDVMPLCFHINFEPGTLHAVGRIGEEIVCEHDLVTYGAPHHLSAEWDEAPLAAGGDTLEVLFTLRDEAGQVVQASDRQVTVRAEGAAAVEAMNAGNLSDPSNYYADHYTLYRGRVKALLRSGAQAGEATLTASCPGVPELTVTIPVQ